MYEKVIFSLEQYFDPDFDESITFLGPKVHMKNISFNTDFHSTIQVKNKKQDPDDIKFEDSPFNDVSSILSNDDDVVINDDEEEISNSLRSRAKKSYTSSDSFRPSFNPPKGELRIV